MTEPNTIVDIHAILFDSDEEEDSSYIPYAGTATLIGCDNAPEEQEDEDDVMDEAAASEENPISLDDDAAPNVPILEVLQASHPSSSDLTQDDICVMEASRAGATQSVLIWKTTEASIVSDLTQEDPPSEMEAQRQPSRPRRPDPPGAHADQLLRQEEPLRCQSCWKAVTNQWCFSCIAAFLLSWILGLSFWSRRYSSNNTCGSPPPMAGVNAFEWMTLIALLMAVVDILVPLVLGSAPAHFQDQRVKQVVLCDLGMVAIVWTILCVYNTITRKDWCSSEVPSQAPSLRAPSLRGPSFTPSNEAGGSE